MIVGRTKVSRNVAESIVHWKSTYLFSSLIIGLVVTWILGGFSPSTSTETIQLEIATDLLGTNNTNSSNSSNSSNISNINNSMKLSSPAFNNNGPIPSSFSGTVSPPLVWSGIPTGTKSLVLIVDDPDAPDPEHPKTIWVHWVVYNIPPSVLQLEEGIDSLPSGSIQGLNDWKRPRYDGPSPPIGKHRYFFKLYALDIVLDNDKLGTDVEKSTVVDAMNGHIIEQTEFIGTYEKV